MNRRLIAGVGAVFAVGTFLPVVCWGQVNSGSDGSDGAFNPAATNTVINMADHPTGIYQYTSVNIPSGVTVRFIPNANNTPVTWLVQGSVVIGGTVDASGKDGTNSVGGIGGPGGFGGGTGAHGSGDTAGSGQGPGGGTATGCSGGCGSFASVGTSGTYHSAPGVTYGNKYLVPAMGGSGGAGGAWNGGLGGGGGGGGGMVLIAANGGVVLNGSVVAVGGNGQGTVNLCMNGGAGSGGGVRIFTTTLSGNGSLNVTGGSAPDYYGPVRGGDGRIRLDLLNDGFSGQITGSITRGFQPIVIPTAGQGAQLAVTSIGGVSVAASPSGLVQTPDAVLSAQQNNPIPVAVHCSSVPLNTPITVTVRPASGAPVSAVGYNSSGTLTSSTATVMVNVPRGGGIVYATAATSN